MYQCLKCGNSKLFCENSKNCKYIKSNKMNHMFNMNNLLNGAISNTLNNYKTNINGVACCQCKYCGRIFESNEYLMYHLYYNCKILDNPISRY